MVRFEILHMSLCAMGLLSETLCTLILEAEAGDKVTIWCEHELTDTGYIYWFKHTSDSVPLILGCKKFRTSSLPQNCYNYNNSEHMEIYVHNRNTSLTITAVHVSDTGLYYCSVIQLDQANFKNSMYLYVKGINKTESDNMDKAKGDVCSDVLFVLTVGFGVVIVILLNVLIFIILKHRKTHRGAEAENTEVADSDSVHYAALQFSKKKTKKLKEKVDPPVIYSSVRI